MQIFAAVGLTGYLSVRNGQRAVNDLASQLQNEISARIEQHLDSYMDIPRIAVNSSSDILSAELLDEDNGDRLGQFMWNQVRTFEVGYLLFGRESGEFLAVGHYFGDDRLTIDRLDAVVGSDTPSLRIWETDSQGRVTQVVEELGAFSFQHERWYSEAVNAEDSIWTPAYNWLVEPYNLSIAFSRPIFDSNQNVVAVVAGEQGLSEVSQFLQALDISPSGRTFIIERSGLLIGSSDANLPHTTVDGKPQRLHATDSLDPLVRNTAIYLREHWQEFSDIQSILQLNILLDGQRHFIQVTPWSDELGLDWLTVVAIPEVDFMAQIEANTRMTVVLCLVALALATASGLCTARWIGRPLLQLGQVSEQLAQTPGIGLSLIDIRENLPGSRVRELNSLSRSFTHMAQQLKSSFELLNYNASHDKLTNLLNRSALQAKLEEAILVWKAGAKDEAGQTCRSGFAVLFLDLDYFKLINDSLGHFAGDELLVSVSRRLNQCVGLTGILARFGGDEFVVLLPSIAHFTDATRLAGRILRELQTPFNISRNDVFISASIGIAVSGERDETADDILRNADIALYRAKAKGRTCYEVFNTEMHAEVVERLQLETELRRAIEREEFEVYYQPIVDIRMQQICGFEALVRWRHPTQGMLPPIKFIPVAEETGMIVNIDWLVLHQACQQMKLWQQTFPHCQSMFVNVNLSSQQFVQPDFINRIKRVLMETGLPWTSLGLEITETLLMSNEDVIQAKLTSLSKLGIQLSIDDFGTGYSSLSYLQRFPIHTLKIDRSFISCIRNPHEEELAIVKAISAMAAELGLSVVAEGVETAEQFNLMQTIGCQKAQGYLLSPPLPVDRVEGMLSRLATCVL